MSVVADEGQYFAFQITTPGAGQQASYTIPGYAEFEIIALTCTFSTDANVTNRLMRWIFDNGTLDLAYALSPIVQAQSLTFGYTFWRELGATVSPATGPVMVPLGALRMLPGWRMRTSVTGIQAGDQLSNLMCTARRISTAGAGGAGLRSETLLADTRIAQAALGG